jgi:hypothetical protein
MRTVALLTCIFILTGCSPSADKSKGLQKAAPSPRALLQISQNPTKPLALPAHLQTTGPQAARELKAWYDNTAPDCGGPDKPAHLCSGIMLRATDTNPDFFPWDPSPGAIKLGGVSFSWLRRDQTFSRTWEDWNGFIFYPNQAIPAGRIKDIKALCSFPINANTWQRPTLQGCGPMPAEPDTDTCQNLKVDSASVWLGKYADTATLSKVCGWDIRDGSSETAAWFSSSLEAHQGLSGLAREMFNEIMLSTWETGKGATLPLHSFFYPAKSLESRAKARIDQARYQAQYGQTLPLIRLAFPTPPEATTVISFLESDQAVGPVRVDFEDLPGGRPLDVVSGGFGFGTSVSTLVEITDTDLGSPHLAGKYLLVDNLVDFPIDAVAGAKAKRKVAFSWACNSYCVAIELTSGRETVLVEDKAIGPMRSGRLTLDLEAPETVRLMSSMDDNARMGLDNLTID